MWIIFEISLVEICRCVSYVLCMNIIMISLGDGNVMWVFVIGCINWWWVWVNYIWIEYEKEFDGGFVLLNFVVK